MKKIFINGSPRKNWNTAKLLKSAEEGAKAEGAETTFINLYDLIFTGCRSCMACKRKGISEPCKCYWKDGLSPVLEEVYKADHLVIGSPVYFSEPTAMVRAFLERATFPPLSYNDYSSTFKGKIDTDVILTMNIPENMYKDAYEERIKEFFAPFNYLNGQIRLHPVCDTLQVSDYSKYDMASFSEEHKKEVHDTSFQDSLKMAYEIGGMQSV